MYYPDFYIESDNLIIEVKPKYQINNINVLDKKNECTKRGYKYEFYTEDELKKIGINLNE